MEGRPPCDTSPLSGDDAEDCSGADTLAAGLAGVLLVLLSATELSYAADDTLWMEGRPPYDTSPRCC